MSHPSCTVVVSAVSGRCGEPGVTSFTSGSGQVYAECASHVLPFHVRNAQLKELQAAEAEALPKHKTRTTRPFVLVRNGEIVGYAETASEVVQKRAERLGAKVEAVRR